MGWSPSRNGYGPLKGKSGFQDIVPFWKGSNSIIFFLLPNGSQPLKKLLWYSRRKFCRLRLNPTLKGKQLYHFHFSSFLNVIQPLNKRLWHFRRKFNLLRLYPILKGKQLYNFHFSSFLNGSQLLNKWLWSSP